MRKLIVHEFITDDIAGLYPLTLAGGKRLFPDGTLARFTLVGSEPYATGVVGLHYARARA